MDPGSRSTVVLSLGAEGGAVSLIASRRPGGGAAFHLAIADGTGAFLSEEDRFGAGTRQSGPVASWEDALALLDREVPYWVRLQPLVAGAAYSVRIRAALQARSRGRNDDSWDELLGSVR